MPVGLPLDIAFPRVEVPERIWWLALALLAASALAHLVSMLGTRWGDRGTSGKALLFSLLLHVAAACGLFAVAPAIARMSAAPDPPPRPIAVTAIAPNTDQPTPDPADSRPLWDQPVQTPRPERDRTPRVADTPPVPETERTADAPPAPVRELPATRDLPQLADAPPETVHPDAAPAPTPPVATPAVTEETASSRPDAVATPERREMPRDRPAEASPAVRDAMTVVPVPVRDLATPQVPALPSLPEPTELPAADTGLAMTRPAPAPLPADSTAPTPAAGTEVVAGGVAYPSRFGRRPSRSADPTADTPAVERGSAFPGGPAAMPAPPERSLASIGRTPLPTAPPGLPDIVRPGTAAPPSPGNLAIPETYRQRSLDRRRETARQNGGTPESERAVELALRWLAASQNTAGYWDADAHGAGKVGLDEAGVDRLFAGKTADTGLTALAVLAFLGAGYTHDDGPHADTVGRSLDWLVAGQRDDGFLGGNASRFEAMYCHGMATYALAEAYGMRADPADTRLRGPLARAVGYTLGQQGEDGGWRYIKGQDGDISMFGWQLMSLKSADIAGLPLDREARAGMVRFLRARSLGDRGGLAAYRAGMPATAPMTAESLFCKQMLGMTRGNPMSVEAVAFLSGRLPKRSATDFYFWYYGTLAMFQYGGPEWDRWNTSLRDLLVSEQITTGPDTGSWNPNDPWGPYGGRIYATTLAALSLEVYYRFLPLYRDGGEGRDGGAEP